MLSNAVWYVCMDLCVATFFYGCNVYEQGDRLIQAVLSIGANEVWFHVSTDRNIHPHPSRKEIKVFDKLHLI